MLPRFRSTHLLRKTRQSSFIANAYQTLEPRQMLTTTLFLDFGLGFENGQLSTTVDEFRNLNGTFEGNFRSTDLEGDGIDADDVINFRSNSRFDFDSDGDVDDVDTALLGDEIAKVVANVYQPFAVDVEIVAASNLGDVRSFLDRNGSNVGNRDAYVFVVEAFRGSDDASIGQLTGALGIAAGADLFSANIGDGFQPINRNDEVALTFLDNFEGFFTPANADAQLANAARIGYTTAHEAGHTFGLIHNEDTEDDGTQLISDLQLMALNSNMRAGIGADRAHRHLTPRFLLPSQSGGFNHDFNNLAGDPNIGLRDDDANGVPDFAYIAGTGANDIIELQSVGDNTINVTITPYSDAERLNAIAVVPETFTLVTGVDTDGEILIDAGYNNDEIRIIGDLNANVQLLGGNRSVQTDGTDSARDSDRLVISNSNISGELTYTSSMGEFAPAIGVQSFDGEVTYANTRISFSEFETDGAGVEVFGFPLVTASDDAGNSNFELSPTALGTGSQLVSIAGNGFVPLTITGADKLTIDMGSRDAPSATNSFVLLDDMANSILTSLNIVGGEGADRFDVSVDTTEFSSRGSTINLSGNLGNDVWVASASHQNIEISQLNSGVAEGLTFEDIQNVEASGSGTVFTFIDAGHLSGSIAASQAVIDAQASTLGSLIVTVNADDEDGFGGSFIAADPSVDPLAGSFDGIVEIIANATNDGNEYRNTDVATTWTIDGGSETVTTDSSTMTLENFNRYIGGDDIDTFNAGPVSLLTILAGGGENDQFNVLQNGTGVISIDGGEGVDGLLGPDEALLYSISGDATGTAGETLNFTRTESIVAGDLSDTFEIKNGGGQVTLDGGDGDNELRGPDLSRVWDLSTQFAGQISRSGVAFENVQTLVGGNKRDQFKLSRRRLDQTISGGGGIDQINGPDVSWEWHITGRNSGNVVASNVDFESIESLAGGTAGDRFMLSPGVLATSINGGGGVDTINGSNAESTFVFDGQRRGQVVNNEVGFTNIELANGGEARDRFELDSTGAINTNINGGGGHDTIQGPNLPRRFSISSPSRGYINFSNVIFSSGEFLHGGDDFDQFVFVNDTASILGIDGAGQTNALIYSNRSSVNVAINGLVDENGASGFNGIGSGIGTEFKNIGQIFGGVDSASNSFRGAALDSNWTYHPVRTSYQVGDRELSIYNFQTLVGNQVNDSFRVFKPQNSQLTIAGGGQGVGGGGVGDSLRMEFANSDNTQYLRSGDRSGEFRFNNSRPVVLSGIETLDNYDYGDAVNSYGTFLTSQGARHRLGSDLRLGSNVDPERNGQTSLNASRDDATGSVDDEDGVILPQTIVAHFNAAAYVFASATGKLDAWIDFNINGRFDSNEKIASNLTVTKGFNRVDFNVPFANTNTGVTNARFRISSAGNLLPTGTAADGEVEDHQVNIAKLGAGAARVFADPTRPGSADRLLAVTGTNGNDNISVDIVNGSLTATINQTAINVPGPVATRVGVYGASGNDRIAVRSVKSEIYGDAGNDVLIGGRANDSLNGGEGDDTLFGASGADSLFGGSGRDVLRGGSQSDVVVGGFGDDQLFGDAGNDILIGGLGSDQLNGRRGSDLLLGGSSVFDNQTSQLQILRAVWDTTNSYQFRTRQIRTESGELAGTGVAFRPGSTIFADSTIDTYFGDEDEDAFFPLESTDLVRDRQGTEISVS